MELITIAAIANNNVIGKNGQIPWRIKSEDRLKYREDMIRFTKLTKGHPIIVGSKTYLSIGPLRGRKNIVLTRDTETYYAEVETAHSLDEAIEMCSNQDAYVIGGARVYEEFLPRISRMEITRIHQDFEGDTFFPKIDWNNWEKVNEILGEGYSFESYTIKGGQRKFD